MGELTLEERLTFLEQQGIPGVRDFFATSALSLLARENAGTMKYVDIAKEAYRIADAMMEQRMKVQYDN